MWCMADLQAIVDYKSPHYYLTNHLYSFPLNFNANHMEVVGPCFVFSLARKLRVCARVCRYETILEVAALTPLHFCPRAFAGTSSENKITALNHSGHCQQKHIYIRKHPKIVFAFIWPCAKLL